MGSAKGADNKVSHAAHRQVTNFTIANVIDELLVSKVGSNKNVAEVNPIFSFWAKMNLAEHRVKNMAFRILRILEVFNEVEGTNEGAVRQAQNRVGPTVVVVVEKMRGGGAHQIVERWCLCG